MAQTVKASAYNVGDLGSIPGMGRAAGEGNGNPLQYSCLENLMDGGAWQATVHGVAKSWTQLSDFTSLHLCEKYYKPITVQRYIADSVICVPSCWLGYLVSWVPLLDIGTNWTCERVLRIEPVGMSGT